MKKQLPILLCLILCFVFAACSQQTSPNSSFPSTGQNSQAQPNSTPSSSTINDIFSDKNILIAYFTLADNVGTATADASTSSSLTLQDTALVGNTQIIANFIQQLLGGDLFSIQTTVQYPSNYNEATEIAKQQQNENARPQLSTQVEAMDDYDIVFVGYPIWWGDMPMAVYSFLETYDFSGKIIIPFCTSGGSGLSNTEETLEQLLPTATLLKAFAVHQNQASNAKQAVTTWLQAL